MESQSRVEKLMMMVIIAALAVAAVASWSQWSVTTVSSGSPLPAATERLSPADPPNVPAGDSVIGPDSSGPADAGTAASGAGGSPGPSRGSGPDGAMTVTGTSAVALTFDDGPDPVNTPKLLDLLRRNQVKATFCVVGTRVRAYPELVRRIVAEGHTLCNHSWQHLLDLGTHTPDEIRADLTRTNVAIHAAVPGAPIRYFRAPGGNFTPALADTTRTLGMTPLLWTVDPRDWDTTTFGTGAPLANHVVATVQNITRPGAIVLSHDSGHPDTATAYAELLPWLKALFTLAALPT